MGKIFLLNPVDNYYFKEKYFLKVNTHKKKKKNNLMTIIGIKK